MSVVGVLAGSVMIILTLADAFESIVQPRRVTHRYRLSRVYYRSSWTLWRAMASRFPKARVRAAFLSVFGPLSLLGLFATWVGSLIVGFGLIDWSVGTAIHSPDGPPTFFTYLYMSGTTFFTLGYGDVTPASTPGRVLAMIESGGGFGFLAVIISYLPVLYQAFSGRETLISLLDARAGSPPSAGEFLARLGRNGSLAAADSALAAWEYWAAELLENHLSFPVLSFYRSQHDNQSWLAALTMMLDASALLIAATKDFNLYQTQLTFAMARHAAVDLALVLHVPPLPPDPDRLTPGQCDRLWNVLKQSGLNLRDEPAVESKLTELRGMYEPFVNGLADRLLMTLPPIVPAEESADNWQRSAWMRRAPGIGSLPAARDNEHF